MAQGGEIIGDGGGAAIVFCVELSGDRDAVVVELSGDRDAVIVELSGDRDAELVICIGDGGDRMKSTGEGGGGEMLAISSVLIKLTMGFFFLQHLNI